MKNNNKVSEVIASYSIGSDVYDAVKQYNSRDGLGITEGREKDANFFPGRDFRYEKNGEVIASQMRATSEPSPGEMLKTIATLYDAGVRHFTVGKFWIDCSIAKVKINLDLYDKILFVKTNYITQEKYDEVSAVITEVAVNFGLKIEHSIGGIGDLLSLAVEDLQ